MSNYSWGGIFLALLYPVVPVLLRLGEKISLLVLLVFDLLVLPPPGLVPLLLAQGVELPCLSLLLFELFRQAKVMGLKVS